MSSEWAQKHSKWAQLLLLFVFTCVYLFRRGWFKRPGWGLVGLEERVTKKKALLFLLRQGRNRCPRQRGPWSPFRSLLLGGCTRKMLCRSDVSTSAYKEWRIRHRWKTYFQLPYLDVSLCTWAMVLEIYKFWITLVAKADALSFRLIAITIPMSLEAKLSATF